MGGVFYHEESANHNKRCKFLAGTLKEVFSHCQTFSRRLSTASLEEECPIIEDVDEMVVSVVRSRAMEKQKLKPSPLRDDFSWTDSPATRELYVTMASPQPRVVIGDGEDDEREEFFSVKSCLSCCSSNAVSEQPFFSVKTNLSRCSSMSGVDMSEHWRRSIIQEFCHCQGWPFGLCRKAVLLPPLPKSPSESWLSRKIQRSTKVI
ncbi:hypothetical protein PHAVU_001G020800 [Phaseolus vulgaris]|uniref:Uncharacterized protein n=1 Tax=Phaseolus vulgaris TaxID=3885 RepID=V7CVA1_PHAVU|nr:hypothetical protein PHAVU_001G020800g [Phaseolus vulgaris]ESW32831.1 hypothetical protein PHAVU_001G020800g [Phaseolus vulgaris]